nr:uncharacterized protein LOC113729410 [Coffea arabica]
MHSERRPVEFVQVWTIPQMYAPFYKKMDLNTKTRLQNSFVNRPLGFQQPWQAKPQLSSTDSGDSLPDIVKNLVTNTAQFQKKTRAGLLESRSGIKNLETQISHMSTAINSLESHVFRKLLSQLETNPKNVSAMTLRSGKEVDGSKLTNPKSKSEKEIEKEIEEEGRIRENSKVTFTPLPHIKSNLLPFPCKLEKTKKAEKEKEILDVFRKVEINIPLLDAIKQISKYAKFLKDLCTHKRKLRGDERVAVGENVSVIFQRKLPPKFADPNIPAAATKLKDPNFGVTSGVEAPQENFGSKLKVKQLELFEQQDLMKMDSHLSRALGQILLLLASRTCSWSSGSFSPASYPPSVVVGGGG